MRGLSLFCDIWFDFKKTDPRLYAFLMDGRREERGLQQR